ncbi:MAG: 2Fe-2S iron-sulfur cluster-binding protein [Armatimonadota bacterium]
MPKIHIDNQQIEVSPGTTILQAAHQAGIHIPTLCHLQGLPAATSCMVCVVKVDGMTRLLPACATHVRDGMVVVSESEEVRSARRTALELLLSDHLGDCVAPCQLVCPARMDIPAMIRHIAAGELHAAIMTIKEHIPLPATLGRICPELCERGCRRGQVDHAVSICRLKRFAADVDLASGDPYLPACLPSTGKRVAIVGAGPAGLSAAYYLLQRGIACMLFDDQPPGGALRTGIPSTKLPVEVLQAEIDIITRLGAEYTTARVGKDITLNNLRDAYDAVLLAIGEVTAESAALFDLPMGKQGLSIDKQTMMTNQQGVFAAGSAVTPSHHAVRAVAGGRQAALAIALFLTGEPIQVEERPFTTHYGHLSEGELHDFAQGANPEDRLPGNTDFTQEEAFREAQRCLHCDCRKVQHCKLRQHAVEYGADADAFKGERRIFAHDVSHASVIYEPGKCIACGLCVQIAEQARESLGLAFIERGFTVRVGVPFGEGISEGLKQVAEACIDACPTGALARRDESG